MKIRRSIKEASTELLRDIKEHPWKYEYDSNDEESRQIYEEVCEELRRRTEKTVSSMPLRHSFKYTKEIVKEIKKHEKIKKYAIDNLPVKELIRHIERYEGKIVHYRGTVEKVLYTGLKDEFTLCFYAKYGVLSSGEILINYRGERVVEGDELDIWGVPKGIKTKKIFAYGEKNFPEIDLIYAEIKDNWIKRPLKLDKERVEAIKQKINMDEIIREKKETQKEERKQVLYGSIVIILLFSFFAWICIELSEEDPYTKPGPNDAYFALYCLGIIQTIDNYLNSWEYCVAHDDINGWRNTLKNLDTELDYYLKDITRFEDSSLSPLMRDYKCEFIIMLRYGKKFCAEGLKMIYTRDDSKTSEYIYLMGEQLKKCNSLMEQYTQANPIE